MRKGARRPIHILKTSRLVVIESDSEGKSSFCRYILTSVTTLSSQSTMFTIVMLYPDSGERTNTEAYRDGVPTPTGQCQHVTERPRLARQQQNQRPHVLIVCDDPSLSEF